jgi:hypothetical protein
VTKPSQLPPSILRSLQRTVLLLTFCCLLPILAVRPAQTQTFNVLHSFTGGGDGASPHGVILDRANNLYGTAGTGAAPGCYDQGCGTVFKLSHRNSRWIFATLYAFQGSLDGGGPSSTVTFGPDGSLYGVAADGGVNGGGVVYNLRPPITICPSVQCSWTETPLYAFPGSEGDGDWPAGDPLVFDSAGNLYGVTTAGGLRCSFEIDCGTVFELMSVNGGWTFNTLYRFAAVRS